MLPILPSQVPSLPVTPYETVAVARQQVPVDEKLTVEAASWYEDLAEGKIYFEGGVKATYGPTVLMCDKLVVDRTAGRMVAEGESRIIDPEGTVSASNITVEWKAGHAVAHDVRVEVGYVLIKGTELETFTTPEPLWVVKGATVELTDLAPGGNRFWADELTINPGKRAVAKRIFYQVLGKKLGPFPSQTFNLDRRVTGFKFPSITNKRGVGIGISWESSILLDDKTAGAASLNIFPGRPQAYQLQFTRSFVGGGQQKTRVSPRSDIGERASDGWFDNIAISEPDEELNRIRDLKSSLSAGSFWNTSSTGRIPDSIEVSKMWDLVYEAGGPLGSGGWVATGRVQRIRDFIDNPWVDRFVLDTGYLAPRIDLGGSWKTHARVDLVGTASKNGQFGIVRSELGMYGKPFDGLLVGAAYVWSSENGTPDFGFDRLAFGSGVHLRADYKRGPYTLRFLTKYDFDTNSWYDQEWEIALAAGSLEPFMSRRSFPSDYRLGVRFRIDQFTNRLLDRDLSRKNRPIQEPDGK